MSLSIVGLFHSLTQQFDGKYGDVGNSARALAQWSITFPFIATASCDRKVTGSSAVKDFYAHFNPVCICILSMEAVVLVNLAVAALMICAHATSVLRAVALFG